MAHLDENTVTVDVFTFKEGLLSPVAHDLRLRVGKLSMDLGPDSVVATFDARSLKVASTQRDGRDASGLLPAFAYGEIERNIARDVLGAERFPDIVFASTQVTSDAVIGTLTLHGQTQTLRCTRRLDHGFHVVEVRLDQRDFGIKPYSAMLGTLKVQPEVRITLRAPANPS